MQPFSQCPAADLQAVRYVLTDIDDTLTTEGRLPACSYAAMENMCNAGLPVIPVTGRPAGWCDHIARMWPAAGVVGENGAFYFRYDADSKSMLRVYARGKEHLQEDQRKLADLAETIIATVPGAAISADQRYRIADLAIDFCEDVEPLDREATLRIQQMLLDAGAHAKISSIHVNGWFGDFDKLSTARLFFQDIYGLDLDAAKDRVVYIGDSPNDAPMFGFFPLSVGVANIADFAGLLEAEPAYTTMARSGEGFAEFSAALLSAQENA